MNNYQILLERINEYLKRDDVVSTSDVISAYDLFLTVKEEIDSFNNVFKKIEELAVRVKKSRLLFSNPISKLYKNNKLINYTIDITDSVNINLIYNHGKITISKKLNEWDIKFSKKSLNSLFFLVDNHELIREIFLKLEEYQSLFKRTIPAYEEMVSDELFIINLDYAPYFCMNNELHLFINTNQSVDEKNVFKKYFKDLPSLYEIVKSKKIDILKKMPVIINELSPISQEFINKRYCNQKTKTIKSK